MEKEEQTVIYVPGSQYVSIANVVIAHIKRVIVSRNVPDGDWILINYADRIPYKFIIFRWDRGTEGVEFHI